MWTCTCCVCATLTEIEGHANKYDEAEPGAEVRHKIDDGNDDVNESGYNAEHNIAATQTQSQLSTNKISKISLKEM